MVTPGLLERERERERERESIQIFGTTKYLATFLSSFSFFSIESKADAFGEYISPKHNFASETVAFTPLLYKA